MTTPYLIVSNASAAIEFYQSIFAATELIRLAAPDGKIAHAELELASGHIMLADEYPEMGYKSPHTLGGSPVSIYLTVDDVDATFTAALAAGAQCMMAVADQFDGDRRGTLIDPFGHIWLLATKKETVSFAEISARFAVMMEG